MKSQSRVSEDTDDTIRRCLSVEFVVVRPTDINVVRILRVDVIQI